MSRWHPPRRFDHEDDGLFLGLWWAAARFGEAATRGRRHNHEDFVFYGAPESCGGTVRLATDGPAEQTVTVDLAALPTAARKIVIAAAIDGTTTFAAIGAIEITIAAGTSDRPLAQATLDAATTERTLLLAELYRRGSLWRIRAVGQGYDHGLATVARSFGVEVSD